MEPHCPEYEYLTIEDKLLVDIEMKKWFKSIELKDLCVPISIFKAAEERIIEILKEENERRKTRNANAKTGVISKKHNEGSRQRKGL